MNARRSTWLALVLCALVGPALAAPADAWLTSKAKIALLTAEGVTVTSLDLDTVEGVVTLHGKVKTTAEKEKATLAVRSVDGVKSVRNLLQVAADGQSAVKINDQAIKEGVEVALQSEKSLEGVKVASVNNGVVLLSGKASSLAEKRRLIELAWSVGGVSRVASEIETGDK